MIRYFTQICNIKISYPGKEILLFDEKSSGASRHVKLHLKIVVAHVHSVCQMLCAPIVSFFGASVNPHNWEVLL